MADPFDSQGTVNFRKPDRTFGDSYTDKRSNAKKVARGFANAGYNVGSDGKGDWTVKGKRSTAKKSPRGRKRG